MASTPKREGTDQGRTDQTSVAEDRQSATRQPDRTEPAKEWGERRQTGEQIDSGGKDQQGPPDTEP